MRRTASRQRRQPVRCASLVPALLVAATLGWAAPAFANDSSDQSADGPATDADTLATVRAPVIIDGEELFSVRGLSVYPAERRARDVEARIRDLASDTRVDSTSLTLSDQPRATWILANGRRVLSVFEEDAALEGADRRLVAEAFRVRIWHAIVAYRSARQPAVLWRHALLTLGATVALLTAAFVCRRLFSGLSTRLERRYRQRVGDVHIQSVQLVKADQLWRALFGVLSLAWAATVVAMVFAYLRYVLALFPWTRGTANRLAAFAIDPMRSLSLGVIGLIPNVVFLAILFLVTRYALKLVRLFFDSVENGKVRLRNFDSVWASPTYKLARVVVIAFALVVAHPYVPGSDTDAFKGVTLFLGVVISLGSSSIVGNVLSGYGMAYRRTFHIGDIVRIGQHIGAVQEMRLLVTHLRTAKNEEVIVPNSVIMSAEVVNYSSMAKERGLVLHTNVSIGYETPWRQVEAMLIEAASRTPGLLRERPPFVLQTSLDPFSITYEINVYCDTPVGMRALYSELHRNILDVFNEYGVQIMVPAYESDPKQRKVVPTERWYAEPAQPPPAGTPHDGKRSLPSSRH
jgi:small-conductance mechanosensitive channel